MKQYIFNFTDNSEGLDPTRKFKFIQLNATDIWDAIAKYEAIYPATDAIEKITVTSISEIA